MASKTKGKKSEAEALAEEGLALRREADALWERGRKDEATELHNRAHEIEVRAQALRRANGKAR